MTRYARASDPEDRARHESAINLPRYCVGGRVVRALERIVGHSSRAMAHGAGSIPILSFAAETMRCVQPR
jgi:hypothetical protein